ncbi:hypothetical protein H2200_008378 [Cladophialophora chaetospira]|uniref:Cytochrome P450 n=1 Tax=Cladophialophora chaetospira TaxID=386627 RepID=A0AA38X5N0_9EURO|nr:hypothetical protein H2200_008378 [Cladophialophora chaetospira]
MSLLLLGAVCFLLYYFVQTWLGRRRETSFGRAKDCLPPPELPYEWPLGIDRIKQLWVPTQRVAFCLFSAQSPKIMSPETCFPNYGFGVRAKIFAPLLGKGIFTQDGAAWKHSRELLRKQFVRAQYQNLNHFREHVDNLLARIPTSGIVDLQPLFFSLTLDTTTALLLGRSVYSLRADIDQDSENKAFSESFTLAQEGLAKRFRIAPWQFLYNPPSFRQACKTVHRYVERYIEQRSLLEKSRLADDNSIGFIDEVAKESSSVPELRDQLLNVLLAGRDTTACCLSWTFRLLVRHPDTLARLRKEISSIMGDSLHPSREKIRKMPFLACVIKESLRLYPPVPLNNRTAIKTTLLPTGGGPDGKHPILVRKGELVVFSQYVNSRVKSIYGADAGNFQPERWEGDELAKIGWAYFPFNGGPRQCLGEDFALMEVSYTIVRLLQACPSITLPDGEAIEPVGTEKQRLTLVLSSADGCRVNCCQS